MQQPFDIELGLDALTTFLEAHLFRAACFADATNTRIGFVYTTYGGKRKVRGTHCRGFPYALFNKPPTCFGCGALPKPEARLVFVPQSPLARRNILLPYCRECSVRIAGSVTRDSFDVCALCAHSVVPRYSTEPYFEFSTLNVENLATCMELKKMATEWSVLSTNSRDHVAGLLKAHFKDMGTFVLNETSADTLKYPICRECCATRVEEIDMVSRILCFKVPVCIPTIDQARGKEFSVAKDRGDVLFAFPPPTTHPAHDLASQELDFMDAEGPVAPPPLK